MFQVFPELIVSAHASDTDRKHTLFRDAEDALSGKLLILNTRRLPHWALSRALQRARDGVPPDYEPMRMESPEEMSASSNPDSRLATFTDGGRFHIDRWLRMEFLAQDFLSLVSEFTEVTEAQRERVLELGPVNAKYYDHDLSHWFSKPQIAAMYRNNPVWSRIEKQLYGDTAEAELG
jgi:hypothetical protein